MKYFAIFYSHCDGFAYDEFDSLDEANEECESYWDLLTTYDQRRSGMHYYVKKGETYKDSKICLDCFDSDDVGKYRVKYDAGPSRKSNELAIDYMLANVEKNDGTTVELYSEMINPTWDADEESLTDEYATFMQLKRKIMDQAEKNGIHPSRLYFEEFPDRYDDNYIKINKELYKEICALSEKTSKSTEKVLEEAIELYQLTGDKLNMLF